MKIKRHITRDVMAIISDHESAITTYTHKLLLGTHKYHDHDTILSCHFSFSAWLLFYFKSIRNKIVLQKYVAFHIRLIKSATR